MPDKLNEAPAADRPFALWIRSLVPGLYPSYAALARAAGTSEANVSRWRSGKTTPSVRQLAELARATGTSQDTLLRIAGRKHRTGDQESP